MARMKIRDASPTLDLFMLVASCARGHVCLLWKIVIDEWYDGGRTSPEGVDDCFGRGKETVADEKPVGEKISPEKIVGISGCYYVVAGRYYCSCCTTITNVWTYCIKTASRSCCITSGEARGSTS